MKNIKVIPLILQINSTIYNNFKSGHGHDRGHNNYCYHSVNNYFDHQKKNNSEKKEKDDPSSLSKGKILFY